MVPNGVGYWEDILKVRQNHATIRMNRKCDGNQYFLLDDEGHDGGNKSSDHANHVIQVWPEKLISYPNVTIEIRQTDTLFYSCRFLILCSIVRRNA